MAKCYGLPYKGSKNKIADWVVSHFPQKTNFYDLFCGGCAITHKCLEENMFKNYFINDLDHLTTKLFMDCLNNNLEDGLYEWVSREDFFRLKETNPIVKYGWSFGFKGDTYLYGKDKEFLKYCLHKAVVDCDFELMKTEFDIDLSGLQYIEPIRERRLLATKMLSEVDLNSNDKFKGLNIQDTNTLLNWCRFQHLNSLERIERITELSQLINNNVFSDCKDYTEIEIQPDSVIYCDIPYKGTDTYNKISFDYDRFYTWCGEQKEIVIISEYDMPEDRFECIDTIQKRVTLNKNDNSLVKTEKLFVPKHQIDMLQGI